MWFAALWRGIPGADLSVIITSEENPSAESGVGKEGKSAQQEVEIKDDLRAVFVRSSSISSGGGTGSSGTGTGITGGGNPNDKNKKAEGNGGGGGKVVVSEGAIRMSGSGFAGGDGS